MTASPPWPRVGAPDRWTHLAVRLRLEAPGPAMPALEFELWARYPAIVLRESVEGNLVREIRTGRGGSASLDLERSLCLAKTGQDPAEAYSAAMAIVTGPVAELYGDKELPEGWRRRKGRHGIVYENDGAGSLRQATLDAVTGLPLEATAVDGRWRWSIGAVDDAAPPDPPDVTDWAKESQERMELPTDSGVVDQIRFRSSTLRQPLEFVASGQGVGSTRVVIAHDRAYARGRLSHPDGRPARLLARGRVTGSRLVNVVAERLAAEAPAPEAAEDAGQWDGRINALVRSITEGPD